MIRINLAPEGKRRRGVGVSLPTFALPSLNLGTLFAVLYVVLVVGIAAYWWALSSQQARLTAEIAAGQTELEQLRVIIAKVNAVKGQATDLKRRLAVLEELMKSQGRLIALVDTFASMIPKDLWITGLDSRDDFRLKVSGAAYFLLLSPLQIKVDQLRTQNEALQRELIQSRAIAAELPRFLREVAELEVKINVLKDKLPTEREMPAFYRSMSDAGIQAGLGVSLFQPRDGVTKD